MTLKINQKWNPGKSNLSVSNSTKLKKRPIYRLHFVNLHLINIANKQLEEINEHGNKKNTCFLKKAKLKK